MRHARVSNESCAKRRKKSVSWADEAGGNLECMERRLEYGKSPDCTLPTPRSSEPMDSDEMDVAKNGTIITEPASSDSTALSLSCDPVFAARLTHSPEPVSGEVEPLASNDVPTSESNLPPNSLSPLPSNDLLSPSSDVPSSSDSSSDDPPSTAAVSVCGWDSNLSDPSDSSEDDDDAETDSKPISVHIFKFSRRTFILILVL